MGLESKLDEMERTAREALKRNAKICYDNCAKHPYSGNHLSLSNQYRDGALAAISREKDEADAEPLETLQIVKKLRKYAPLIDARVMTVAEALSADANSASATAQRSIATTVQRRDERQRIAIEERVQAHVAMIHRIETEVGTYDRSPATTQEASENLTRAIAGIRAGR